MNNLALGVFVLPGQFGPLAAEGCSCHFPPEPFLGGGSALLPAAQPCPEGLYRLSSWDQVRIGVLPPRLLPQNQGTPMLHLAGDPKGGRDIPPYGSYSLGIAVIGASEDADKGAHLRCGQERGEDLRPQHPLDHPEDRICCSLGPSAQGGWFSLGDPETWLGKAGVPSQAESLRVGDFPGKSRPPLSLLSEAPYKASGPTKAPTNPSLIDGQTLLVASTFHREEAGEKPVI